MLRKILWILAGLLLVMQLIRPNQTNPPVDAAADLRQAARPPAEVMTIIKDACYDCHSNETVYPWYSQVAPVSWWVNDHIAEGREKLNFSEFGNLGAEDRAEAMEESAEEVREGKMPLPSYTWLGMHPKANLSDAQRQTLVAWFEANGGEGGGGSEESAGRDEDDD
jgi:hypothetical protein